jgi:hypothetical protein
MRDDRAWKHLCKSFRNGSRGFGRHYSLRYTYCGEPKGGQLVARKTILVCDSCGTEVGEGKGAVMRVNYTDARRGSKQADLCDGCAGQLAGSAVARRGRRPKSAS